MTGSSSTASLHADTQQELGSFLWDKLKSGKYDEALKEIKDERHNLYLVHNSLDLVPIILKLLAEGTEPEGEECIEKLLTHVASVAKSKEAIIVFLEELEMNRSDQYFRVLLKPMQTLLLREVTEKTRPMLFSWVFNTLYSHVAMLDLPKNYNLDGEERKLMDFDPNVQTITKTLQWLGDFYAVFYEKVMKGELVWGGKVQSSKQFLAYFLLQLFHKPLSFLDVYSVVGEVESELFRICNKFASMIAHLLGNSFKLFDKVTWKRSKTVLASDSKSSNSKDKKLDDDDEAPNSATPEEDVGNLSDGSQQEEKEQVSQLSLACYFYCILSQNMALDHIPCVHSQQYVYLNCLPLVAHFLELENNVAIHKGLMLAKTVLDRIPESSLPCECLEAKAHSSFPQLLIRVMTFCDNLELRTLALAIFRPYLKKFDQPGRWKLLKCLFLSVKHAGVIGVLIHELKENIAQCLNEELIDIHFSGNHLNKLVLLSCSLPDAETTDLLDWSDSIMAALNMLIFVFIRDKEDRCGIRGVVPSLQKDFLENIQKGLDLSRAHYELKLRELDMPGKSKRAEININIKGVTLPNMPPDQEKKVIQTALCTFDMMQCVLARAIQVVH